MINQYLPDALTLLLAILALLAVVFSLFVLLTLPFALARGEIGRNARAVLRELLRVVHALISALTRTGGRR